MGKILGSVTV